MKAGDVGYIITGIKNAKEVKVGDTITLANNPGEMIHGFEEVKPMVFAGIFPVNTEDFEELRDCMGKLQLNDASLTLNWKLRRHLVLVSVAGSLDCCIWRSSRNDWSVNSTRP
jgi:translation elongation factor EF-4